MNLSDKYKKISAELKMNIEEKFMERCLQIARNGASGAPPNPMVGAVIVHENRIIGEGYHIKCGGPHAEVNAIRSVKDPSLLKESTIYVSLEPCAHYGKTPPCADLIIAKGIPRVVIGCKDPFSKVAGQGIQKLKEAGVEVITGVKEAECIKLNKRFFTFHLLKRPYITLKWAESSNGFIDKKRNITEEKAYCFSTPFTQMCVHRLRSQNKAIMVGRQTALADNPSLTNRLWPGESPIRIVIDKNASLPSELQLFDGKQPTRIYYDIHTAPSLNNMTNVYVNHIDYTQNILPQIINDLYNCGIQTLLVEGGHMLLDSFIKNDLWDELFIEQVPEVISKGTRAPEKPKGRIHSIHIDQHEILHIIPESRIKDKFI